MPEIYLEKIKGVFVPATEEDDERLKKLPSRHVFKMTFTLKHNYLFHKKVFAFLLFAFEMQDHFDDLRNFRKWLIAKAGYFNVIECPNGYTMYESDSLSYEKMSDLEKDQALKAMINTFLDWRCDDLSREDYETIFKYGD